ncbi:MAG: hypothetical protein NVSMB66_4910 [Candidatus Doudnabacteria bacterium]
MAKPLPQAKADIVYDRAFVRNWQKKPRDYHLQVNLKAMMDRAAQREDYEFACECRDALKQAKEEIEKEKSTAPLPEKHYLFRVVV